MFADPCVLDKAERTNLVGQLRECVKAHPRVSELRVLFGMALCVNFEVPDAIEELREGVRLAPHSFIAHLKMGELWMRLRVMDKAEEHTHRAALLAGNRVNRNWRGGRRLDPSDEARRYRAGRVQGPWLAVTRTVRRLWRRDESLKPSWQWISASDAAGPSTRAVAGDFAPGREDCGLALYSLRNTRHPGELLVGVALGPGAFNLLHLRLFQGGEATGALMLLAQVGGMVLMFIAGIETDVDRMREASLTAFLVALPE